MAFTPENATDTQILALTGDAPLVRTYHRDLPLTVHIEHSVKADVLALLIEHGYSMEPDGETGCLVITKGGE